MKIKIILVLLFCAFFTKLTQASTLGDIIICGFQENNEFLSEKYASIAREKNSQQLKKQVFPKIDFSSAAERSNSKIDISNINVDRDSSTYTAGVRLTVPIYNSSALIAYKQSPIQQKISEYEFHSAKQNFILKTIKTYIDNLTAKEELNILLHDVDLSFKQLKEVEFKYKEGVSTSADLLSAKLRYSLAKIAANKASSNISVTNNDIKTICQKEISTDESIYITINSDLVKFSVEDALIDVEKNNPDLLKLNEEVNYSLLDVKKAESEYYPTINGIASYQWKNYPNGSNDIYDSSKGVRQATIGVQLSIPLYSGDSTSLKIQEGMALSDKITRNYHKKRDEIESMLRSNFEKLHSAQLDLLEAEKAEKLGYDALTANKLGYSNGVRLLTDVLMSQEQLFKAQHQKILAKQVIAMSVAYILFAKGSLNSIFSSS